MYIWKALESMTIFTSVLSLSFSQNTNFVLQSQNKKVLQIKSTYFFE